MTARRFDNFAQRLTAAIPDATAPEDQDPKNPHTPPVEPEADPEEPTTPEPEEDQEMDVNSPEYQAGMAAGMEAANTRMTAVFASEHFAGREASAAKMLGKPNMSAADITDLLADMPKAAVADPAKVTEAAEEAARQEMQAEMAKNKTVDLGADEGSKPTGKAKTDAVWDKANANTKRVQKEA